MELMTAQEAADYAGVEKQTIYNHASTGRLKKAGRGKFRKLDVDEWLSSRNVTAQITTKINTKVNKRIGHITKPVKVKSDKIEKKDAPDEDPRTAQIIEARVQREQSQAEKIALDLAVQRGEYLDKKEFFRWVDELAAIAVRFRDETPRRLAAELAPITTPQDIESIVEREVVDLVERMREVGAAARHAADAIGSRLPDQS